MACWITVVSVILSSLIVGDFVRVVVVRVGNSVASLKSISFGIFF